MPWDHCLMLADTLFFKRPSKSTKFRTKEIFRPWSEATWLLINLAFVSKLIEKAVAAQLNDHLLENNLMEEFQSAYRKGHSTETALLRVQSDILHGIDQGKAAYLILLDLSAGFDTIDHEILLKYMEAHLGIGGTVLNWFRSYLCNRKQSVVIDGVASQPSTLKYGVPQGSVLGPVLFCICMLPLSKIIKSHNMALHIYADDTQMYCFFLM